MTTDPLQEHLSSIEALLAQAAPTDDEAIRVLRTSQDFWEVEDYQAWFAAEADMQSHLAALTTALTTRWGAHLTIDLFAHLQAGFDGEEPPAPLDELCQQATTLQAWPLPDGRWLGLTIAQWDKELPLQLLAAVGDLQHLT
ncbi:hypothetical protein AB0953_02170 [Streptomyces sp. NPDC046866]|uniref:hypothetical protein n=1 Tax=Streptomyces sp. NPDC046866 TaxID=3154921 RepID=UPI00345697F1